MSHPTAAALMPRLKSEGEVALRRVDVQAVFHDLLGEVSITQTYRNREERAIEAVYTFPLALDAVLLELTVRIGDRTLTGQVTGKEEAQEGYEDAVADGDTAILLTQPRPGLYVMNVGNLQAGEEATVTMRYAQLFRWQGDQLRVLLPTTLAPRYGTPDALEPHETPSYTLDDALRFTLAVELRGGLREADVACPSHGVDLSRSDDALRVELAGGSAVMDRDFVLTVSADEARRVSARAEADLEGTVALASFHPDFRIEDDSSPRLLKIVVDCSGSMSGDSIAQARAALREILDHLRPQDRFNLVAFGSSARALFDEPQAATEGTLKQARAFAAELDATMGGTELGAALRLAYGRSSSEGPGADLLLITDGEVWNHDPILQAAAGSGHRHFTVGVGSAVTESLLREMARRTGGACELVAPREDMAERVVRHFKRIYFPRADSVEVRWPGRPVRVCPERPGPVFTGDTVHAFAWFEEIPEGEVVLELRLPGGSTLEQRASIRAAESAPEHAPSTLARLAARERLVGMDDAEEAVPLAVAYQLVSRWTSCLIVDVRPEGEKADGLPALRKVPHTVPAGWHGVGSVMYLASPAPDAVRGAPKSLRRTAAARTLKLDNFFGDLFSADADMPSLPEPPDPIRDALVEVDRWIEDGSSNPAGWTMTELRRAGFPEDVLRGLRDAMDLGFDERAVVIAFLHHLARSKAFKNLEGFTRRTRRVIRKAFRALKLTEEEFEQLEDRFFVLIPGS